MAFYIMSLKKVIYTSIALIAFLTLNYTANATSSNKGLTIKFSSNGQQHIVKGKKTALGYLFNEKSDKALNLATLNWPPYISKDLCNNGWVFQFTVALLVSKGYQVNINFYPWARSIRLVEQGVMDILFPEYFIESSAPSDAIKGKKRRELLVLSNKFPGGEVSLLKRKGYNFDLQKNLRNLKGKVIGVVRGYQNTPEFDAMMDAKQFTVASAVDELQLIKLLVGERVDLIVGDPKVFNYSINYSNLPISQKKLLLNSIEIVKPSLQYNYLYFAISNKYPHWHQLLDDINLAMIEFQQSGETNKIINEDSNCTVAL